MDERESLYRTVCADADDDTPRMVFADWLQENGDEPRAEFIRTQCRLAGMSRTDPGWGELDVRQRELLSACGPRFREEVPFREGTSIGWTPTDLFGDGLLELERGFRAWAVIDPEGSGPSAERFQHLIGSVVASTPARQVELRVTPGVDAPASLLRVDNLALLRGLSVRLIAATPRWPARMFNGAAPVAELERLRITTPLSPGVLRALTTLRGEVTWRELALAADERIGGGDLASLFRRKGIAGLRSLTLQLAGQDLDLVGALNGVELPELRRLNVSGGEATPGPRFDGPDRPPKLESLRLSQISVGGMEVAEFGDWESLTEWALPRCGLDELSLGILAGDSRFASLRSLDLRRNTLGGQATRHLAGSRHLSGLRSLDLQDTWQTSGGLRALLGSEHLTELRHLGLGCVLTGTQMNASECASAIGALELPGLTSLDLSGQTLGEIGARALADRECLTGLRVLRLRNCRIKDGGMNALLRSPYLQGLEFLDVRSNDLKGGADALTKPDVMPRLARCELGSNPLKDSTRAKLRKRAGVVL